MATPPLRSRTETPQLGADKTGGKGGKRTSIACCVQIIVGPGIQCRDHVRLSHGHALPQVQNTQHTGSPCRPWVSFAAARVSSAWVPSLGNQRGGSRSAVGLPKHVRLFPACEADQVAPLGLQQFPVAWVHPILLPRARVVLDTPSFITLLARYQSRNSQAYRLVWLLLLLNPRGSDLEDAPRAALEQRIALSES